MTDAVTGTFKTNYSMINPGLTQGMDALNNGEFSWLPAIARNYQRYKIHSLRHRYEPICGSATIGTVGLMVLHESRDTVPTSLAQFLNFSGAQCAPLWASQQIVENKTSLDTQPRNGRLVRQGAVPANESLMDFDFGYLVIATDDAVSNTPAGLVFVDVDIEFFLPVA